MNCDFINLIGCTVDLAKADKRDFDYDEVNYPSPVLDKSLSNYEARLSALNGFFAYSIRISLNELKITNIERIAHSYNISSEYPDEFTLLCFPTDALEQEAEREVRRILDVLDELDIFDEEEEKINYCVA
jgi:hypothetical protein